MLVGRYCDIKLFKILFVLDLLRLIVPVLVNVAFITLAERKLLGLSQSRVGPNKVGVVGLAQPFADAIKLFSNQNSAPLSSNFLIYFAAPVIRISLALTSWCLIPRFRGIVTFTHSVLLMIVLLRFRVYPLLLSGWSSNRKYSILGALRGVAQTISYEIRLSVVLMFLLIVCMSLRLFNIRVIRHWYGVGFVSPVRLFLWLISFLAETNRTPFDFSEGESELVSGFNIEYCRTGFAILFMAEYARIYFRAVLSCVIWLGTWNLCIECHILAWCLVSGWVWVRATLPRYRYDLLIGLAWKRFLPISLRILQIGLVVSMLTY